MTSRTRSARLRLAEGARLGFPELDALLDVPAEQWDREVARLVRAFARRDVRLEIPASRILERGPGGNVTWVGLFESQVRLLPRMDRDEEFRMARRYEFQKALVRDALARAGFGPEGLDELVLRPVHALPAPGRRPAPGAMAVLEARIDELERLRNLYVEGALYLVLGPVRRYRDLGVDEWDLIQEGNASLFQAIEGFDWRRDVRFKTYAVYWIQQAILKTLYNASRTVRIPIWVQKAYRKIRKMQEAGRDEHGYEPAPALLADRLGMPVERIEEILSVRRYAVSLDAQIAKDEDGGSLGQLVPDEGLVPVHEAIREGDLEEELRGVMAELPDRERMILTRRYGLDGGEPETLAEIAADLGVTAERVRQLQKAALERLQKPAPMQRLRIFA